MKFKKFISIVSATVISVSSISVAGIASEMPSEKAIIWNAEFDGNDNADAWRKYTSAEKAAEYDFSSKISDGVLKYNPSQIAYGRMGAVFSPALDVENMENVYWETRFKFEEKIPSSDKKLFFLNDKTVQIYLLEPGVLAYGGKNADDADKVVSDFKMKSDTWYTVLVKMDFGKGEYSVSATGDDNTSYDGTKTVFSDDEPVTEIESLRMPRAFTTGMTVNIDYIRLWDDSESMRVDVLYNGEKLDSKTDMPLGFDADVSFTEKITQNDISKITINNGASLKDPKLSEDKKRVTFSVSDLEYETEYEIFVPEIGNNPKKTVKFTTQKYIPPEVKVVYGSNDEQLDGAKEVSYSFDFKVLFECPIEESDVLGITINNDTGFDAHELSGDGKTLKLTLSNLASYTRYTVTIPALAGNAQKEVSFTTINDLSYLYEINFDGTDSKEGWSWKKDELTGATAEITPDAEGNQELSSNTIGGGLNPIFAFDEAIDLSGKENFFAETRIKFSRTNGTKEAANPVKMANPLFSLVGSSNETWAMAGVFVKENGILGISGNNGDNSTAIDYTVDFDTWYTFRIRYNQKTQKYTLFVSDDLGEKVVQTSETSITYPTSFPIDNVLYLKFANTYYTATTLDYLRIWSTDFEVLKSSVRNNEIDVRNDADFTLSFSADVDEETAKYIKLTDNSDNLAETEISVDGRKVNIYCVAGLKNDEAYMLTVPASVKDIKGRSAVEKKIVFVTEKKAFRLESLKAEINKDVAYASAEVKNPSEPRNVCLIIAVYDDDGNLVKMQNIEKTIPQTDNEVISASFDVSGLNASKIKAYLWCGNKLLSAD